jgi:hypothetical protein
MKYSFKKGIIKAVISVVLVGVPLLLQVLPTEALNLTLGGLLVLLQNYVKFNYVK